MLAYGSEVMVPTEIGLSTHKVQTYDPEGNITERRLDLDPIKETKEDTEVRQEAYQQRTAKFYNKRVKARPIGVGDLVMKRTWKKPNKIHANCMVLTELLMKSSQGPTDWRI